MNSTTSFLDRSPEAETYDRERSWILEKAVLSLSDDHRHVFMLRDVEELTTEETAECLNLSQENVKVRPHRAHAKLRRQLFATVGATAAQCFQFRARRCDRVVSGVFKSLGWKSLRTLNDSGD